MKKVLFLTIACLALFSAVAMAGDITLPAVDNDGQAVVPATPSHSDLLHDDGFYASRSAYNPGNDKVGDQAVTFTSKIEAFLPCYVEMRLRGNDIDFFGANWDADTATTSSYTSNPYLAFYPGASGYIHNDWSVEGVAASNKTEVRPGSGHYIRSCDYVRADLYSNLNYKYSVKVGTDGTLKYNFGATNKSGTVSDPSATGTTSLPVEMRFVEGGESLPTTFDGFHDFSSAGGAEKVILNGENATEAHTIWHQFRVPYGDEYPAGIYRADIAFMVATI